jgi:cytochrome c peroxidase
VPVPEPSNLADYVADRAAAIELGKAFFWDMQTGSDGLQACATCHFHAGADHRTKNQVSPGTDGGGSTFDVALPNGVLTAVDFPFRKLSNVRDARSAVLLDSKNIAGSQGVHMRTFEGVTPGDAAERGAVVVDPHFNVHGENVRQVTPRNVPTVINAIFNFRNFWDGRASDVFNGVSPFGPRDVNARVFKLDGRGDLSPVIARLDSASLASLATGPPGSSVEMSYSGRVFPDLGRKLLALERPLAKQLVARDDSVLGRLGRRGAPGLDTTYRQMIERAFRSEYWSATREICVLSNGALQVRPATGRPLGSDEFTEIESNFSLFWGLAIQLYLSTLVSDDALYDRVQEGRARFTYEQEQGLLLFTNRADAFGRTATCTQCHAGAELTLASSGNVSRTGPIERDTLLVGGTAVFDTGFRNTGVRPTSEDIALGGTDPSGNPFSFVRSALLGENVGSTLSPPLAANEKVAVDGAFKVSGLRNVELTGPYFHNGGQATLRQVVDFYARGADFSSNPGFDSDVVPLGLNDAERGYLVEFLLTLTDERVRREAAPFDHPQLFVPDGASGDERAVRGQGNGEAVDVFLEIPATGARGGRPIGTFLGLDPRTP